MMRRNMTLRRKGKTPERRGMATMQASAHRREVYSLAS